MNAHSVLSQYRHDVLERLTHQELRELPASDLTGLNTHSVLSQYPHSILGWFTHKQLRELPIVIQEITEAKFLINPVVAGKTTTITVSIEEKYNFQS